ncbi:MAG: 2-oxoacid:acceptor oxidoreductase family protein [Candidatus Bathyarchaeota archaeon]|nr:MAG: 2-oxoacid:acceptor oxidoreductase family protein [Candidatus Bathyarchaeota archaeon]
MSRTEVRICGLGGQGVVLAGQILGRAAVYMGKNAVQTQSYGAEARGSAAKSEVIISSDRILFPKIRSCDLMVAMSQSALDVYVHDVKEEGQLFVDSDLVTKLPPSMEVHKVAATRISRCELGSATFANVVMLGAFTRITRLVSSDAMEKAISESVAAKTKTVNHKAFQLGFVLRESH